MKRDILERNAFHNLIDFRLYFLIVSQAMFRDGVEIDGERLKIGEWKRSYRKLQDDLKYYENRTVKRYGIATLKRAIKRLEAEHLVCTRSTNSGTVFIVPDYASYQGFSKIEGGKAERIAERKTPNSGTKRNNKIQERNVVEEEDARTRTRGPSFFDSFYLAYGRQPNPKQTQILLSYIENDNLPEDVIKNAIEQASRVSSHFNYLTAILNNWATNGIKEPAQTKGAPANAPKQTQKKRKYSDNIGFDW